MESSQFKEIRAKLGKTQKKLAELLGVSVKAVHSYEQGWRKVPHHVERQLLFLLSKVLKNSNKESVNCWDVIKCPDKRHEDCPAREFAAGDLCWFINGTKCNGEANGSWEEKMKSCRACKVFKSLFELDSKEVNKNSKETKKNGQ